MASGSSQGVCDIGCGISDLIVKTEKKQSSIDLEIHGHVKEKSGLISEIQRLDARLRRLDYDISNKMEARDRYERTIKHAQSAQDDIYKGSKAVWTGLRQDAEEDDRNAVEKMQGATHAFQADYQCKCGLKSCPLCTSATGTSARA